MSLRHAFYVVDPEARLLGVFTEHLGYHCFPTPGLRVRRVSGTTLLQEQVFA
jgi:hypothetical protein